MHRQDSNAGVYVYNVCVFVCMYMCVYDNYSRIKKSERTINEQYTRG